MPRSRLNYLPPVSRRHNGRHIFKSSNLSNEEKKSERAALPRNIKRVVGRGCRIYKRGYRENIILVSQRQRRRKPRQCIRTSKTQRPRDGGYHRFLRTATISYTQSSSSTVVRHHPVVLSRPLRSALLNKQNTAALSGGYRNCIRTVYDSQRRACCVFADITYRGSVLRFSTIIPYTYIIRVYNTSYTYVQDAVPYLYTL